MALRGGYDLDTGVMTMHEVGEIDAQFSDTKGRYKPLGVYYRGDRFPEEFVNPDTPYFKQEIRRLPFVPGQEVKVGPGTNRACRVGEIEQVEHPYTHERYCLKPCKQGYVRNWYTNRCRKEDAVRRRRYRCRPGYHRTATGRCAKGEQPAHGDFQDFGEIAALMQEQEEQGEDFQDFGEIAALMQEQEERGEDAAQQQEEQGEDFEPNVYEFDNLLFDEQDALLQGQQLIPVSGMSNLQLERVAREEVA
jgi:hypothetical protein